jgi:hypothetical protein
LDPVNPDPGDLPDLPELAGLEDPLGVILRNPLTKADQNPVRSSDGQPGPPGFLDPESLGRPAGGPPGLRFFPLLAEVVRNEPQQYEERDG